MSLARVFGRVSRTAAFVHSRHLFSLSPPHAPPHHLHLKASPIHNGLLYPPAFRHCGMSTSVPHGHDQEKKDDDGNIGAVNQADETTATKSSEQTPETGSSSESQPTSDSDSEEDFGDLSKEELAKAISETKKAIKEKNKEFREWKDKFLRSYAEVENAMERTRRDAENSKKFAVQSFAKDLLDVADNLSRASSITKESFTKIDVSNDTIGSVPVLKTLLEGVEMTEKQLAEVFRKSGIEKVDPTGEQFNPNRHNAVFQVPDSSKPSGTVAVVLKVGYKLHDRIIRPAEVGVTVEAENKEDDS